MDLGKTSTVVRPRSKWQALDLGFKMASHWYRPLVYSWIMVSLPLFLLLHLFFDGDYLWVPVLLVWWLKPLWERIQLGYLSFAQFGESSTLKQLFKRWLSVLPKQWLATLTWRRLTLQRSYAAPIVQLESLGGSKRAKRLQAFEGDNQQAAIWLTIVLVHVESFITLAVFALLLFLVPADAGVDLTIIDIVSDFSFGNNLLAYFSMALVSPFFVASGFALYLNQRTQIEGWDIEITFRRMVERQQQKSRKGPSALLTLACVAMLSGLFVSDDATAADEPVKTSEVQKTPEQQSAYDLAQKIAAGEQFNRMETKSYPEFYLDFELNNDKSEPVKMSGWLAALVNFLAGSFELILTALVVALILLLIYKYRHWLAQFLPADKLAGPVPDKPTSVFGLDIDADNMPDDPAAHARLLWQQGEKRQSLSLLYRGSLLNLVNSQHLDVHDSYTEGECMAQVKQNAQTPTFDYFEQLTRNWQRLAYAGIMPDEQTMTRLFEQWHDIFTESDDEQ